MWAVASRPHEPATIQQLVDAMVALGLWEGQNTAAEHRKEAARLGGRDAYRLSLCNALLGAVQAQAGSRTWEPWMTSIERTA